MKKPRVPTADRTQGTYRAKGLAPGNHLLACEVLAGGSQFPEKTVHDTGLLAFHWSPVTSETERALPPEVYKGEMKEESTRG